MYGLIMKDAASIPTLEIKSTKDEVRFEKILVILPVSFFILSIKIPVLFLSVSDVSILKVSLNISSLTSVIILVIHFSEIRLKIKLIMFLVASTRKINKAIFNSLSNALFDKLRRSFADNMGVSTPIKDNIIDNISMGIIIFFCFLIKYHDILKLFLVSLNPSLILDIFSPPFIIL